jgi:hypothetical protein
MAKEKDGEVLKSLREDQSVSQDKVLKLKRLLVRKWQTSKLPRKLRESKVASMVIRLLPMRNAKLRVKNQFKLSLFKRRLKESRVASMVIQLLPTRNAKLRGKNQFKLLLLLKSLRVSKVVLMVPLLLINNV